MTVGIVYRPPSQTSFLETMNEHFYKRDTINKETNILGDFNINLYLNNKYVFEKCSTIVSETIPYDVRKYQEFCNVFNLKQLIPCPTRITCSSSAIIDHILASYPDRISQKGIILFYSNFIQKLTSVIDEIAPCKTKRVKGNSKDGSTVLSQKGEIIETNFLRNLQNLDYLLTRKTIRKPATKLRN